MRLLTDPAMLAGIVLDIAGLGVILWALPEGGVPLAAGVGCLLAGAALITRATSRRDEELAASLPSASADWRLDPVLRQPLPRRTKMKPAGVAIGLLWLLALGALGWFAAGRVLGLNPPVRAQSIAESAGVSASAEIYDKVVRANSRGEPRYYLYYSYEFPEGSEVRASIAVTPTLYNRYQVNDVIQLKILPADPPVVVVPEFTRPPFALGGLALGGVVAALLLVFLDSQRRRHKHLVASGLPVAGTVGKLRRRGASRNYLARYRVGAAEYSVRASERNPQRRNHDRVTVLHDAERPETAVVYEAAIYRAVPPA